jgi:uncharacterized protein (DUF2147 family)
MKIIFLFQLVMFFSFANAQDITGKWKTIDDKTGQAKSIIEIYVKNDKYFGKIIEIFDKSKRDKLCEKCEDQDKNKPVLGLVIIKNIKKEGVNFENGTIMDPENGKTYSCSLTPSKNKLKVRGFVGFSMFGRNQTWEKVE